MAFLKRYLQRKISDGGGAKPSYRQTPPQQTQTTTPPRRRMEVYLIRHGYSIANRSTTDPNMLQKAKGLLGKTLEPDPSLTRTGIEQCKLASKKVQDIQPDFIFTSVLCRAQQTALFMFPSEGKVIVAPYLKEKNNPADEYFLMNSDNKPFQDILTQYEKRHNVLSEKDLARLTYSKKVLAIGEDITIVPEEEEQQKKQIRPTIKQEQQFQVISTSSSCCYNDEARGKGGNIQDFLTDYLYDFLIRNKVQNQELVKVAVVCHGGIIRDFLNEKHMNNNAVFKVSYTDISNLANKKSPTKVVKVFDGFRPFKVSCDPQYVRQGQKQNQLVQIKYPSQQIRSKRGDYTNQQLKHIYQEAMLQREQTTKGKSFGAKSQRVKTLIQQIKNPGSEDEAIIAFKKKNPILVNKSLNDIKQYFQENPKQLDKLVLDPGAYQKSLNVIRRSHQLSGNDDAVKLINQKIRQGSLHKKKDIFNLIVSLPSQSK